MLKQNRIMRFTVLSAGLFIVLTISAGFAVADSPPGLPQVTSYWGYVTINNTSTQGVTVSVYDSNGTLLVSNTSLQGGLYQLSVPWDNPNTQVDEGVVTGQSITFKLNGGTAQIRSVDVQATNNRLDLSISGTLNYDSNGNGKIDRNEAINAVIDYFDGKILKQQAIDVIIRFFSGQ